MFLRPYIQLMRLDKPIGIWLVFCPALWGALMAHAGLPDPGLIAILLLGAVVTRAAGCVLNDLADRDLDAAVARTQSRPLASGALSRRQAVAVLVPLLALALVVALLLPWRAVALSVLALPMIAAYPWMKRITWWPQLFLGLTFNLSALIGWAATGVPLERAAWLLYLACICWTLGYDTIYALQDKDDDARVGIKSSALRLGSHVNVAVSLFYTAMLSLWILAGMAASLGPFFLLGVAASSLHATWQVRQLVRKAASPGRLFISNQWLGGILSLALLLDRWWMQ